ncbi:MAG: glycosyltransferase family 4 protein, partial [Bdellovibrionota bacterium]
IGSGENMRELAHAPIEVTGWLPRENVLKTIHNKVDIYLHTSLWEGMPLAILEAMALRKPVVATDCVGNSDVVAHGRTGFLGATPDELTHGLLRLVDDARWRDKMGMAGRARVVAEFSLPLLIRNISNLYQATYDLFRATPASK